jgi:hypothetical protein
MSGINLLGDVAELTATRVKFNIAFTVEGAAGHVAKDFATLEGLRPYLTARAFARIVGDSLSVSVSGSVTSTRSIDAHLCVIPRGHVAAENTTAYPQTAAHVASVPGSCFVQHSVTSASAPVPLGFPDGITGQLKPPPVWGVPPTLVVVHEILGGSATSTATIKISGVLEVGGIGFVQTW